MWIILSNSGIRRDDNLFSRDVLNIYTKHHTKHDEDVQRGKFVDVMLFMHHVSASFRKGIEYKIRKIFFNERLHSKVKLKAVLIYANCNISIKNLFIIAGCL